MKEKALYSLVKGTQRLDTNVQVAHNEVLY